VCVCLSAVSHMHSVSSAARSGLNGSTPPVFKEGALSLEIAFSGSIKPIAPQTVSFDAVSLARLSIKIPIFGPF
jgi:hypothetical protein